jgi:hypothetical protein
MEDSILEVEPDFTKAILAAREIEGLTRHPGWKHVEKFLNILGNTSRLALDEKTIQNAGLDAAKLSIMVTFISGEISTVTKLSKFINTKINYGKALQQKLNIEAQETPATPAPKVVVEDKAPVTA